MSHVSVTTEAIRPTIITARGAGSGMNRFRYADRYSILSGPEMGVTGTYRIFPRYLWRALRTGWALVRLHEVRRHPARESRPEQ